MLRDCKIVSDIKEKPWRPLPTLTAEHRKEADAQWIKWMILCAGPSCAVPLYKMFWVLEAFIGSKGD